MDAVEQGRGDGELWNNERGDRPVPAIADELSTDREVCSRVLDKSGCNPRISNSCALHFLIANNGFAKYNEPMSRLISQRLFRVCAALLILISSGGAQTTKVSSLLDMSEFIQDWKISKQFTLEVANAMPAEFYNFKPNFEEMTFGEQMAHIAGGNVFRFQQITGIQPPFKFDPAKPVATDKDSVMKMLEQSFDYVITVLPQIAPEQLRRTWHIPSWQGRTDPDGRAMILNMLVHTAHHRAQCEVYLRVKGIKPPDYRF
jgi:uncharacterized damage-inducible protein DinB